MPGLLIDILQAKPVDKHGKNLKGTSGSWLDLVTSSTLLKLKYDNIGVPLEVVVSGVGHKYHSAASLNLLIAYCVGLPVCVLLVIR